MKTPTKKELTQQVNNLAKLLEHRSKTITGLKVKIDKQKKLLNLCGTKAANYENQIQTMQAESKIQDRALEHAQNELREREHSLRNAETDYAQEMLGTQHVIDKAKQDLYNEQIKSTAYMTVIKALHDH